MVDLEQARTNMLKQQVRTWGVLDPDILDLIATTPREAFVPDTFRELAFADFAIPIGHDQFMLPPKEEAFIIQALKIKPSDRVLEIGTGSGYMTALLAKQAAHVESVDIFAEFTKQAGQKLIELGIMNVTLTTADAATGWNHQAPYDVIVITGSLPILPRKFRDDLAVGGRLFAIIGMAPTMEATLWTRVSETSWSQEKLFETVVTPMINAPQLSAFKF